MILYSFIAFSVLCAGVAFVNWRLGVFLTMLVGVIQDPVRKMVPGTPVWLMIGCLAVWTAVCAGAFSDGNPFERFKRVYPQLTTRILWLLFSIIPASAAAFRFGTEVWMMVVVGVFTYVAPIVAMGVGFAYARNIPRIEKLILYYCVFTVVMLTGTFLENQHLFGNWKALGTASLDTVWLRWGEDGSGIRLISGFYRSPDIMGWHAATVILLSMTMVLTRGAKRSWGWILIVLYGLECVLLGGRRKTMLMPIVWLVAVGVIYALNRKIAQMAGMWLLLIGVAIGGVYASHAVGVGDEYVNYLETSKSETLKRISTGSIGSLIESYDQNGFWGIGIGSASIGARHFMKEKTEMRNWQEDGLSKIFVELGSIGFITTVLLLIALTKAIMRVLQAMPMNSKAFPVMAGLIGLLFANAGSFVVSHQIFGDPLLLVMLSFFIGVALSAPLWKESMAAKVLAQKKKAKPALVAKPKALPSAAS